MENNCQECQYKTEDGKCKAYNLCECKPSTIDWCNEPVKMIPVDCICKYASYWGNSYYFITEEQLEELKNGKVIYVYDGEYSNFIAVKKRR